MVKMTSKKPIINKCCGILPNRACLVIFAVLKIIPELCITIFFGYQLLFILAFYKDVEVYSLLIVLGVLLDIAFMITLIVGATKKSNILLKISFYYSIISLILAVALACIKVTLWYLYRYRHIYSTRLSETENLLIHASIITVYILIHIYMILVMDSEIAKTDKTSNGYVYHKADTHNGTTNDAARRMDV